MKQLQEKLLALLLMALLSGTGAYAQEAPDKQKTPDKVVIFRFLPGEEMFSSKITRRNWNGSTCWLTNTGRRLRQVECPFM